MSKKDYKQDTLLMHLGRAPKEYFGMVNPPIARVSTIAHASMESYETQSDPYAYARLGTPLSDKFESAMAVLENGFGAVSAPSGLAVITPALLEFLKAGDHLLVADCIYGRVRKFCDEVLVRYGVEVEYYDPMIGAGIESLIRDHTALIFMESPGSGIFEVMDVPAIAAAARKKNVITMCDNTWGAGLLFRPLDHGVDISLVSATKYIGGHADIMLGTAVAKSEEHYRRLKKMMHRMGICASQDEMYLALRGLRTMKLRLHQHAENAMKVAQFFQGRDEVQRVYYPPLSEHPGHDIWRRDFSGANGLMSILLKEAPKKAVAAFVDSLELFPLGISWGGYESLIVPVNLKPMRKAVPWTEKGAVLRIHIGLEDPEDLIADLTQAFEKFKAAL